MKKIYVPLLIILVSSFWLNAQEPGSTLAQPQNIIGRRINASGETTKQYEASFSYDIDGRLNEYVFPEWGISSTYGYDDVFLTEILTVHEGTWPIYDEAKRYTYEDGRVKLESHTWSDMNSNEYISYSYYDDGRLKRKDYASYHPEDVNAFSLFKYENDGKTRIESYSKGAFQGFDFISSVRHRTVSQYDDNYRLLSVRTDYYDENGSLTNSKRVVYHYTIGGNLESMVTQTLAMSWLGLSWENNTIHKNIYNEQDVVTEQQDGTWSKEMNDWNITKKTVHEYSSDNKTYTVSFYKKSGNAWVRDVFDFQELFFEPELRRQQEAMGYWAYEDLLGSTQVNQLVFEMVNTKTPVYNIMENDDALYGVYPNPGEFSVVITAPVENAVIRIYDLQGRLVIAKPFNFNTTINVGNWTQGIYLWEVWNGTKKEAGGKWIKK